MKLLKKNQEYKESEDYDYDFDFSDYEREDQLMEDSITSITDKKPNTSNFTSKYGASLENIMLLNNIRTSVSDAAIKVASRSGDMKDINNLYGCLNEAWAVFKDIYGQNIIDEINNLDRVILRNILLAQEQNKIPEKLYQQILLYRDKLYMLIQRAKLGFEVEKNRGSAFTKAKKGMVE